MNVFYLAASARGAGMALALSVLLAGCAASPPGHYHGLASQQQARQAHDAGSDAAPDPAATHRSLIEQMQREGLWYASLAHIDALERDTGAAPWLLRLRADALRRTGQTPASRAVYERLAKEDEAVFAAAGLHGLGLLAGQESQFAQAVAWLEQARRHQPTDPRILGDLGYALLRAGRLDEARVPLMQAAQLQPQDQRLQLNLAAWLLATGRTERAEQALSGLDLSRQARAAVQEVARQARLAATPAGTPAPPRQAAVPVAPPVALRASGWQEARRVHIGVRRVDDPAGAPASDPAQP